MRVVAFVPDLLFGSNVVGALQGAGHDVELVSDPTRIGEAEVLIVDLTADAEQRLKLARSAKRTLAFYAHVEQDVREAAVQAGFDLVVPRSRMAREGPALVERLLSSR